AGELTFFQKLILPTKYYCLIQVLGLVVTGCDTALTMRGEVQYIWKAPLRITFVRCLFVLTRYLPVALHMYVQQFFSAVDSNWDR
ncbi:hypothetical protein BDP27DRAFT_1336646, partial [Rhodocollybia butyracea]